MEKQVSGEIRLYAFDVLLLSNRYSSASDRDDIIVMYKKYIKDSINSIFPESHVYYEINPDMPVLGPDLLCEPCITEILFLNIKNNNNARPKK